MSDSEEIAVLSQDGLEFTAKRDTLVKHCDYFAALFNSGMRECKEGRISLLTLASSGLEFAFKYLQDEKPTELLWDTISMHEAFEVCSYLQMNTLMEYCITHVKSRMSIENCFRIYNLTEEFMLPSLKAFTLKFFANNFYDIMNDEGFLRLGEESVIEVLSNAVYVLEIEIFDMAYKWITYHGSRTGDRLKNINMINSVFRCIRFPLMDLKELDESLNILTSMYREVPFKALSDILIAQEIIANPMMAIDKGCSHLTIPRIPRTPCVLIIGGFTKSNKCTNRMMVAPVEKVNCRSMFDLPWGLIRGACSKKDYLKLPVALCEHRAALLGDIFVYIAGGQSQYCMDGRHTRNNVYRLDTRDCTWVEVNPMLTPRSLFYLGTIGNQLYAVGGLVHPRQASSSVERYNAVEDHWYPVAELPKGIYEHAGCVFNGYIFVSGGLLSPGDQQLKKVYRYDQANDTWTICHPMTHARSYHSMVATKSHLLVLGGANYLGAGIIEDIKNCEMYDPLTDQWSFISPVQKYASSMSSCVIGDSIYLFGGHSFEIDKTHYCIQIYDSSTGKWSERRMKTHNVNFFECLVAHLPTQI